MNTENDTHDEELPDDLAELHDPEAGTATVAGQHGTFKRAFALCRDGFVVAIRTVESHLAHPFGDVEVGIPGQTQDPKREHVAEVTGIETHVGYIVDNKGNVAPPGTRTEALPIDKPGYHDMHVVEPVSTAAAADLLTQPPTDSGHRDAPPVEAADAKRAQQAETGDQHETARDDTTHAGVMHDAAHVDEHDTAHDEPLFSAPHDREHDEHADTHEA